MASMPDPGAMPGEDPQGPDQSTVDAVNSAVNQGYSYADVVAYHADNNLPAPPQPSLDAIMGNNTSDASTWASQGSDPTKLDTAEQVAPLINQIAESGFGIGAVEGVGMRAAKMGVEAVTAADTVAPVSEAAFVAKTAAKATIVGVGGLEIAHDTLGAVGGVVGNQVPVIGATPRRPRGPESSGNERTI